MTASQGLGPGLAWAPACAAVRVVPSEVGVGGSTPHEKASGNCVCLTARQTMHVRSTRADKENNQCTETMMYLHELQRICWDASGSVEDTRNVLKEPRDVSEHECERSKQRTRMDTSGRARNGLGDPGDEANTSGVSGHNDRGGERKCHRARTIDYS